MIVFKITDCALVMTCLFPWCLFFEVKGGGIIMTRLFLSSSSSGEKRGVILYLIISLSFPLLLMFLSSFIVLFFCRFSYYGPGSDEIEMKGA
jgi:hypothetical protein